MAEGGGNQREEEIIDEPEGQWIQIPVLHSDEIKKINNIIKEQVNQLKLYLERKRYTPNLAEEFASQLLLTDDSIEEITDSDGPDDDTGIQDETDALKAKLPRFLIIIALVEPVDTKLRANEIKKRELSVNEYMKNYCNISHKREFVEDFSDMKEKVRDFIGKTPQTEMAIVVFMGHGSKWGTVRFAKERVPIRTVLKDLEECRVNSRKEGLPLGELRIVFSQCYGHMVDDDADEEEPKVKHTSAGTQYMYLSNSEKDPISRKDRCKTTTVVTWEKETFSPFSHLEKLDHPETDVCLDFKKKDISFQEELFKSEVFENMISSKLCQQLLSDEDAASMPEYVKVTAKDLYLPEATVKFYKKKPFTEASKDLKESEPFRDYVLKRYFSPWVKKGPSEDLPQEMTEEVNKYRRKMKRFIVVQYGPMESTHDKFNHILAKWVQKPFGCLKEPFECGKNEEKVDSKEAMFKTIDDFINQSKVMHVVLVYGTGHREPNSEALLKGKARTREKDEEEEEGEEEEEEEDEKTERLVLHLSDTEKVPAEDILQRCIKKKERLRMVFCCSIKGSIEDDLVWFSNAFPPAVARAVHLQLMKYAMIIVGPGPQTIII